MAHKCKLVDNGNTVEFTPIGGYDIPEERPRDVHRTLDGSLFIHEWGNKEAYSAPINMVSTAAADRINTWWQNKTTLTFTPDVALPAQTVSVKIINETRPLQMGLDTVWKDKYAGVLELRQP